MISSVAGGESDDRACPPRVVLVVSPTLWTAEPLDRVQQAAVEKEELELDGGVMGYNSLLALLPMC